ncbi:hypothetical protein ACEWY4_008912 [Coilia grayii]|uniref:THD domain-containing protein n=1 Tax=Coilia grayii TaxID=363190 RepID=A0ABD1K4X9_9TELE
MTSNAETHANCSELTYVNKQNEKNFATKWNVLLLTLSLILGAETLMSVCLLHGLFREITKTQEEIKFGKYPVDCLHRFLDSNIQTHNQIDLQTCDFLMQELQNRGHRRLKWDIKNTIFESLTDCNVSQEYLPACHVGAETELHQLEHLQTGNCSDWTTSSHRLRWNNVDGQVIEDGLMHLTPDGEIVVPKDGLYFVYSQVYFQLTPSQPPGRNLNFFQTIYKRTSACSQPVPISKAREGPCLDPTFNTQLFSSHQGALFHLRKGDKLTLSVWDMSAVRLLQDSTYFGAFMVK